MTLVLLCLLVLPLDVRQCLLVQLVQALLLAVQVHLYCLLRLSLAQLKILSLQLLNLRSGIVQ